jgi:hypothetical protein
VLVDPDPRVEREAVEEGGVATALERVGEAHPTVNLGGLERGEWVDLRVGACL